MYRIYFHRTNQIPSIKLAMNRSRREQEREKKRFISVQDVVKLLYDADLTTRFLFLLFLWDMIEKDNTS